MKILELTEIGKILKPHKLSGDLKLSVDSFYLNDLQELETLVLQKGDDFLPFFIEHKTIQPTTSIVKFESIHNKDEASKLNGKTVYAITSHLSAVKENEFDALIGMTLFDQNQKQIGQIEDVIEHPKQILLQLFINKNEILIPFHEDLILSISQEENMISLTIPDGLIEIYSNDEN